MFRGILPKEVNFYNYFEKHITLSIKAATELLILSNEGADVVAAAKRIKDFENEADDITHLCTEELHKTFITPFERADIHNLIKNLDDIIDNIDGAVSRILLYEITIIRNETKLLADILVKCTMQIEQALKGLRNMKDPDFIIDKCKIIHQLESEGDAVLRSAILRLFKEGDAIPLIMWKEIFQKLEKAVDKTEAVANIIEGVVISAA